MKVTFETSARNFELANHILAMAIDQLTKNPFVRANMELNEAQVKAADTFRRSLVKAFMKASKEQWKPIPITP